MTPAIPLLTGWICIAMLFTVFPARRWTPGAAVLAAVLVVLCAVGVAANQPWQLLAFGCTAMAASAVVGARMAQDADSALDLPEAGELFMRHGITLIAWSWLLAGLANAAIGLLQYFQNTAWLGDWVNHAPRGQVYGNIRQRNQYATLMNIALWALWFVWREGSLQRLVARCLPRTAQQGTAALGAGVLAWLCMVPLGICLALTLSRTGFMQLLFLAVLLAGWTWRFDRARMARVGWWLAGLMAVYALAGYVMPMLAGMTDIWVRLEGKDSRACISRTVLWGNVLQLVAQKPLTGWGWGELDYAHYYADYPGMRFCEMLDNAHDLPLHLAVELGVPAALAFCALVVWGVVRNRPWSEARPERQLMWGVLGAIAIHSLLEYPLWYAPFQLACGLALGVLWTTRSASPRASAAAGEASLLRTRALPQGPVLMAQLLVACAMTVALIYACFDFVRVTQLYTDAEERMPPFRQNTLAQASRTVLYQNAVHFAQLTTEPLTPENAAVQLARAQDLMHYSPEARVAERIVEALRMLGRDAQADAAERHLAQVYPQEYAHWKKKMEGDAAEEASGDEGEALTDDASAATQESGGASGAQE